VTDEWWLDDVEPAGFPDCRECAYLSAGQVETCHACATAVFQPIEALCPMCAQEGIAGQQCRNKLCHDSSRTIGKIAAITMKRDPIEKAILRLKYSRAHGWAPIFGRLLLGHLQQHYMPDDFDLIVANPTLPNEPGRLRHTELVIESAHTEDLFLGWPFDVGDPRAIVKTASTPRSAGKGLVAKIEAADALRAVLHIPFPARVKGRRILVYDDVCTTGYQLDRVAQALVQDGGAASVEALVLARAIWAG